jgi:uncharacterized protein (DUF362 family)
MKSAPSQERVVVAYRDEALEYPRVAAFDPPCAYPEYPFAAHDVSRENSVYGAVRDTLRLAGLDAARFGTPAWNPLGDLVSPGATVVIKPNWVRHYHPLGLDIFSIITHPAVLRPLIDYAFKAVGPTGRIWLMDAPLYDSDFARLTELCQLEPLATILQARGVPLMIGDLRSLVVEMDTGVVVHRTHRHVWESEGVEFDLGGDSEFEPLGSTLHRIFGSDYDRRLTTSFHSRINGRQRHCYRISRRVLEADLVISVPKLKTHKKTGVTLNIKNMIGINTNKNYIPHYRVGSPCEGGDEFPDTSRRSTRTRRRIVRLVKDHVLARLGTPAEQLALLFMRGLIAARGGRRPRAHGVFADPLDVFYETVQGDTYRTGDWWGNDTCWRSALDMNKILLYGTPDGTLQARPVRRYFSLIDGIVGGDEQGPLAPTPRPSGVLLAGFDPLSVDTVATQVMGLDSRLIRDQRRALKLTHHRLAAVDSPLVVRSNVPEWHGGIAKASDLGFRPHPAWTEYFART